MSRRQSRRRSYGRRQHELRERREEARRRWMVDSLPPGAEGWAPPAPQRPAASDLGRSREAAA